MKNKFNVLKKQLKQEEQRLLQYRKDWKILNNPNQVSRTTAKLEATRYVLRIMDRLER